MAKDPAFLFYPSDFLTGTSLFSDAQVGKYMRLLCLQFELGHLSEDDMMQVCKKYDERIFKKFIKDNEGLYFNKRLELEAGKRSLFVESRRNNRLSKKEKDMNEHMNEDMKNHMCEHMENGNENINKPINKKFVIPTVEEVTAYCQERNNGIDAEAFINFYEAKGWRIGKEPMKDWRACVRTWEKRTSTQIVKPKQRAAPDEQDPVEKKF